MPSTPIDGVLASVNATDRTYYLRRALQEQEAACAAACVEARERHEELAAAYRRRCRPGAMLRPRPAMTSNAVDCAT
jgi:hypothetical protein